MEAGGIAGLWQTGRDDEHDEQVQSRESHVMIDLSSFLLVAGRFCDHSDVKNRQNQS